MLIVNKFKIAYKSIINNYINKVFTTLDVQQENRAIYNIIFNIITPNKVFYITHFKYQYSKFILSCLTFKIGHLKKMYTLI